MTVTALLDRLDAAALFQLAPQAIGPLKARRIVVCANHDEPDQYMHLVFFDSHEEAMENSSHPAVQEFAGKMMAIADGPPTFYNLDVIEER